MGKLVHRLVATTAKAIAAEVYEVCASTDRFYKAWPNMSGFVSQKWGEFIDDARKSLTAMLVPVPGTRNDPDGPKYKYGQHVRDEVFEALCIEGEQKSAPTLTLAQLRAQAGFEPEPYAKGHRGGVH